MNRVVLAGRLTKDPELRITPNGNAVANFTIAINRPYRNQQGQQEADFINCVAWRKQAENVANYQKKGNLIGVDGKVQSRSYESQEGRRVFVTEILAEHITFLEPANSSEKPNSSTQEQFQPSGNTGQLNTMEQAGEKVDIEDSSLPF